MFKQQVWELEILTFVFDLDGTICFKGQPISNKISAALKAMRESGHRIIFASARPIRDMLPVIPESFHKEILIGGNGSLIAQNKEIVHSASFSNETMLKLHELMKAHQITYLIDGEWDYAYTGPINHPILQNVDPAHLAECVQLEDLSSIVKVLFLTFNQGELLIQRLQNLNVTIHLHHQENIIDLSPTGISKWSALSRIGIQEGEYIAFGNDANDISMFQHAKQSIMIGDQ